MTNLWTHEVDKKYDASACHELPDPDLPSNSFNCNASSKDSDEGKQPFTERPCSASDVTILEWGNLT